MASGLFSSIQSLSTKLLDAIRGTTSTSHQQQDPPSADTDQNKSVRKDLEKLSRMLARIQAVQQDAEEREIHDRSVRLWLTELRGVAYQAEDVLDEFYYEVLRTIVESGDAAIEAYHRDGGTKRKFSEMDTSSFIASYSFSIPKAVIPDGMAEKIKSITERFEEISNARRDLHLKEEDGNRLVTRPQIRPPTSYLVDGRAIFGREREKENIISLLNPLNDPKFMVLPIVGMGGLGKTTLAQLVYNDSKFLQLFDKRAWVSVSEDFDLVRLTRAIIESINKTTCEFSELSTLQDILKEKISHVSLFLVLDDVWNENTELWEQFQVALKGGKSVKILTTTRNTSVSEIMQTTSPIQLDCLPNEKCWSLFKHFAFDNGEASENGKLLDIGYGIVKNCKGSPLVTKVLGGILRYEMDEEKWMEVLGSDISQIDESGKIFTPLQLSYQKLPLNLKPCFVYLAMFPKGKMIKKDHVVRLWMAQGYINSNSSRTKKTLEEIGSEYLNELQGRSLIDCWNYNTYYIHDLIHDLARSISQRTNQLVLENDNLWNSSYKINHLYLTEKQELSDFLASGNNKVIRTYIREYPGNYKYDWKCPRNYIDDSAIFSKITYVRALQLLNCVLPDTLSALKHLRYLSIIDDNIESLPESLCHLYHLQTLDMNCHNIRELPENIKTLINLRILLVRSGKIKQLPESISLLHNLDTLSIERCSTLENLPRTIEQLTNLRVLKLSELQTIPISNIRNLFSIPFLESISLSGCTNLSMLLAIPQKVEVLEVNACHCHEIKFSAPSKLKKLSISNCRELTAICYKSWDLPFLESISLFGCPNLLMLPAIPQKVEVLEVNACGCQEIKFSSPSKLKNLSISNCRKLITIYYKSGDLPFLKSISLSRCPRLSILLDIPQKVELLEVNGCGCQEITFSSQSELKKLSVSNCGELVTIYYKSGDLPFLVSISLFGCPNLLMLPAIPEEMKQIDKRNCGFHSEIQNVSISDYREFIPPFLDTLSIECCSILENLLRTIEQLTNLRVLKLSELQIIPISNIRNLFSIPFLESISLSGCTNLSMLLAIPQKVEVLEVNACHCHEIKFSAPSKLRKLSISNCRELTAICYKSGDLPFLESISLFGCPNLPMLPAIPQELKMLHMADFVFQEINLSSLSKLQKISISNCSKMVSIDYKIGDLPFLESISLSGCSNLPMLPAIPQKVEVLEVNACGCQEIKFSAPSKLKKLSISNCRELTAICYKSGDLPFLESISLFGCPNLLMLPAIPQKVEVLDIKNCGFQEIHFSSLSKLRKISVFNCTELVSIYYKFGDLPFLESISLSGCPKLLIFSAILEEMKQMDKRNSGFQSEIQNVSIFHYTKFIPTFRGRVCLSNCPKLRIFSAIPTVELDALEIIDCGICEIILPSRCKLLEIRNCPELISVHWRDGDSSSLPLVKFVDCPQLKLLKIPKEVKVLKIKSCGTHEFFFSSQSMVRSVDIYDCRKLFSVHWMDGDVSILKDLFLEGCPELISLPFLQGDLPLLENFAIKSCPQFHEVLTIPYQLKELKIVDCCFPEIHLSPQSKLQRLIIHECANLTAIKGLQVQFPTGDVSHPMMEMVDIRNCPRMDFGTQGNSYFYQVKQEASQDFGTEVP